MKKNEILEKINAGQQVVGTFMEINDTSVVESLGIAGLDFLIVDFEHSTFTAESLLQIVQTAELREMTPLMRVKDISRANILRPLDVGIKGLIIPNIYSVEEVKQIVQWGKYAPLGQRGFFTSRVTDFGFDESINDLDALFEKHNQETMIIPQCETVESLEAIEDIAAIDGVAGIFVGPFDLSIALGIPTQFDHPKFTEALDRIYKACRNNNKFIFSFGMDPGMARTFMERGFDAVTCSMDASLLIGAAKDMIQAVKG